MENVEEKRKTESQVTGLKAYLLGRLGTCWGYDPQTRQELITELKEIEDGSNIQFNEQGYN